MAQRELVDRNFKVRKPGDGKEGEHENLKTES